VYKQILINPKLQIGKRGKITELTARSTLKRQRSALDCNAEEEEEGGGGGGERDLGHGLISTVLTVETSLVADFNLVASGQSSKFIYSITSKHITVCDPLP